MPTKISGLGTIGSHATTDLVEVEDASGSSFKTTFAKIASFLGRWFAGGSPTVASLTIVSGDGTNPTFVDDPDVGLTFDGGAPVAGDKARGAELTIANANADWTWTVKMEALLPTTNYSGVMVWCRDNVGGKMLTFGYDQTATIVINRITALAGPYSAAVGAMSIAAHRANWFRIAYTNSTTTFSFQISMDGKRWQTIATELVATFITNKATRVGFGATYNRGTGPNIVGSVPYAKLT